MINLIILNLFQQLFLVLVGLSLLQLVNIKKRVSLFYDFPYAWGVGVVFLYLVAFPLIRFELAPVNWYWIVFIFGLIIFTIFIYFYKKLPKLNSIKLDIRYKWYDFILLGLILIKIFLLVYVNLVNPVVDSDASDNYRHIGLAKYIFHSYTLSDTMAYKSGQTTVLSPPILHAWSNIFQDRWHDSIATIHYLVIFIFTLFMIMIVGLKQNIKTIWILLGIYLFSTIPLLNMHVIRPGFADIIVMYFFLLAVSVLISVFFIQNYQFTKKTYLLSLVAILGMAMTKMEGIIWASWFVLVLVSYYIYQQKSISWKKILLFQLVMISFGYIVYFFSANWVLNTFDLPIRLTWLFEVKYDPKSFDMFFGFLYTWGGQGLIWWLLSIASITIIFKSKNINHKALIIYILILMFFIFYFANFTGNVKFTLIGTNVGRFLLQISPLIIIVYYLLVHTLSELENKKNT